MSKKPTLLPLVITTSTFALISSLSNTALAAPPRHQGSVLNSPQISTLVSNLSTQDGEEKAEEAKKRLTNSTKRSSDSTNNVQTIGDDAITNRVASLNNSTFAGPSSTSSSQSPAGSSGTKSSISMNLDSAPRQQTTTSLGGQQSGGQQGGMPPEGGQQGGQQGGMPPEGGQQGGQQGGMPPEGGQQGGQQGGMTPEGGQQGDQQGGMPPEGGQQGGQQGGMPPEGGQQGDQQGGIPPEDGGTPPEGETPPEEQGPPSEEQASILPSRTTASSKRISGVAAGDSTAQFGLWASPFYSYSKQSTKNTIVGYKNKSHGVSIGFDTSINEDGILGVALTASKSIIKLLGTSSGDKTKTDSLLLSIYGMQNLTDDIFILGTATLSRNNTKNYSHRVTTGTNYDIAYSKYKADSFSAKATAGYNITTDQATITPMAGLKYSLSFPVKYSETGAGIQNLSVSGKQQHKFDASLGLRSTFTPIEMGNEVMLTPEASGSVTYTLNNRAVRNKISLSTTSFISESGKAGRVNYSLGAGATASYRNFDYSVNYNLGLADKFISHQGSLKIKVNF